MTRSVRAGAAGAPTEPARVIGWGPRGVTLLLLADCATLGGLAGQAAAYAALSDPDGRTLVPSVQQSSAGGIGMMLGLIAGLGYAVWPMMSVSDGGPAERRAYRALGWLLLGLHPLLLAGLTWDYSRFGQDAVSFVFLAAPVAIIATPLLAPVARALFSTAGPGNPARGRTEASAAPRAAPVALALPFVAAWRAGRPALASLSAILWLGGCVLLAAAPVSAVAPFALAYGIGWRALAPRVQLPAAPSPASSFSPLVTGGLLCVPLLFVLDALALSVLRALLRAGTLGEFAGMAQGSAIVLIVVLTFALLPVMVVLPLNMRFSERLRPAATLLLGALHLALAAGFGLLSAGARAAWLPQFAPAVLALIAPLAWAMALASPLAALLAASAFGGDDA